MNHPPPKLRQCQCMYRLVSGAVKIFERNETLIEAVIRITDEKIKNASIGEIRPILHFKNHFISVDHKMHTHEGIGFICRLQMNEETFDKLHNKRSEKVDGVLVDIASIEPTLFAHGWNRLCFETGKNYCKSCLIDSFDIEMSTSRAIKARQQFHNFFIKPIFNLFKTDIKGYIASNLPQGKSAPPIKCLDVSCGEDNFLLRLSQQLPNESILIGNDVSWGSLRLLNELIVSKGVENIYLTNHSGSDLPYADNYFDFCICKNTLHHLRDYKEVCKTIENLLSVTKGITIIIDFEDPKLTGRLPHWIHIYFKWWLKDAGDNFLSEKKFEHLFTKDKVIKHLLKSKNLKVTLDKKNSIFGKSLIAIIEPSQQIEKKGGSTEKETKRDGCI